MPPAVENQTERQRLNQRRPKNHSDAEVESAHRVLEHWNKTFAGVDGASQAQHKTNLVNVRLFIRVMRKCQQEGGAFAQIAEPHVLAAITAYRADAGCVRLRSWKCFAEWLSPEKILKYCGGNVAAVDPRQTRAREIIAHLGLDRAAKMASQLGVPLSRYLREQVKSQAARRDMNYYRWFGQLSDLQVRFESLSSDHRARLAERARTVFECANGAQPAPVRDDVALSAIALALMDLDSRKGVAPANSRCSEAAP